MEWPFNLTLYSLNFLLNNCISEEKKMFKNQKENSKKLVVCFGSGDLCEIEE